MAKGTPRTSTPHGQQEDVLRADITQSVLQQRSRLQQCLDGRDGRSRLTIGFI